MPKELKGTIADFVSRFENRDPIEYDRERKCTQVNQSIGSSICDEELASDDWSIHENPSIHKRGITPEALDCKAKAFDCPVICTAMFYDASIANAASENANGNDLRFHLEEELHPPVFSVEEDACIHSVSPFARSTGIRTPDQAKTPKWEQCPSSQSQNKFFVRDSNSPITLFSKRVDKNLLCKSLQSKIAELSQALEMQRALRAVDLEKIDQLEEQLLSTERQLAAERQSFLDANDSLSKQLHEALEALSDYRLGSQLVAACSECSSDNNEMQILRSQHNDHVAELKKCIEDLKESYMHVCQQNLVLSNQVCHRQLCCVASVVCCMLDSGSLFISLFHPPTHSPSPPIPPPNPALSLSRSLALALNPSTKPA
jgi:hypothetical protein